jgi:class 3 adenylate cyclase
MRADTCSAELAHPVELRVGIATGLVIVGDIGPPQHRQLGDRQQ